MIVTMAAPTFEIDNSPHEVIQSRDEKKLSDSTASLSSSDNSSDLSSRIEEFESGLLRTTTDELESSAHVANTDGSQRRKKSVRFSAVYMREYDVVDELPSPDAREDEAPRRTLGWDFSESQLDIETHLQEVMVLKKERYARLIYDHILRKEQEREQKKNENKKKHGWKARMKRALKPVGQSLLEAATRTNYMMAAAPL
jgi:hypothetical protein